MNIHELKTLLEELAERDLADGSDIYDHPCIVAIRALDECFEDINTLRGAVGDHVNGKSKEIQTLVKLNYSPSY